MRESLTRIFKVVCGCVAAVIGAGFASGQEILTFFVKYGRYSIAAAALACAVFTLFTYALLRGCAQDKAESYSEYLGGVFGVRTKKIISVITLIFCFASVCVMTACAGETASALLGIRKIYGALVFTAVCGVIFMTGSRGVVRANSVLGAVMIVGMVFCCFYMLRFREHQAMANAAQMTVSGTLYAGYNIIGSAAIIAEMSRSIRGKREAALAAGASGLTLFVLIVLIWTLLSIYAGKISLGEIPMLTLALRQSRVMGALYGVMLIFAVLTTGISNGFAVLSLSSEKTNRAVSIVLMLAVSLALSTAGFSRLIDTAYRICGYAGAVIAFVIIFVYFRDAKERINK